MYQLHYPYYIFFQFLISNHTIFKIEFEFHYIGRFFLWYRCIYKL